MTRENNCMIEDVDNACVEMSSEEIGVKKHDNFCDGPYDDSCDHNCGDAYIENVVGNVDCVVENVHANLLENVRDINAKHDDDICDNSSNACKNATYDLHNNALKCGNDFWVDNEINLLNPYDFNDSDSFDSSDDDDGNCVDTCENNSFNSNDNDGLESFTFDDNSLINEHFGELHDMLCNVDDELNVDASLLDLNDVEFDTFHDNCLDDAIYIHDLLGEEKEETDGDLRDVFSLERKNEQLFCVGLHPRNDKILSFLRSEMEDGSSWIAVLSQYNSSKHSISPNSSGNFSNLEQPDRITAFTPFNLQMLLGRLARCLQLLRAINLRFVRHSIDGATSLIAIASARTSNKQAMGPAMFGKFSSFKQPERIIVSSFSK
nr:hypothetical protein Itr_chr12CG21060 [Ipomoea trifida]